MADMKDRAREYLRRQTQLNGGGLFHCNILNLILGFAEQETKELKKNYEDSLIACGVLKAKVDTLAQPSLLESMQDALITTQKVVNEKQKEQLSKAKEIIKTYYEDNFDEAEFYSLRKKAEQFLNSEVEK